ncbi:MAG: type II secretion system F family protein [Planctomycetota bacterium]|nr:type II secretion system F family protein [Planctomycetota bacterium]
MPNFEYTGQLPSGTAITGTFEAASPEEAQRQLGDLPLHVMSLAQAPRISVARPLSRDDLTFFNQQLASLAETGIALDQGLRVMARDLRRGKLRRVVDELAADMERGVPFEEAVQMRRGAFPPLYAEILKAGVRNNQLGSTLFNLNSHFSLMESARRLFWESALYPIIVLSLGFLLVTFFMKVVVPSFEDMLVEITGTATLDLFFNPSRPNGLPILTTLLFEISRHWSTIVGVFLGTVIVALLLLRVLRTFASGRALRESIISAVPGFGPVHNASLLARFSQAAALGVKAGHDLPAVLRLAAGATGNARLADDAENLARHIEAGGLPVESAVKTRTIPAVFGYVAHVAAARGQLALALAEMARNYQMLARHRLSMLRMFLLPLFVLLTAIVLCAAILALFAPLVSLINSLSYV